MQTAAEYWIIGCIYLYVNDCSQCFGIGDGLRAAKMA